MSLHIQRARCKTSYKKPYRLAVQNNKNEVQDFDSIPGFLTKTYAEIFLRGSENVSLACPLRKNFAKSHSNIRNFNAFWGHF